jgi:hypothetical protein
MDATLTPQKRGLGKIGDKKLEDDGGEYFPSARMYKGGESVSISVFSHSFPVVK